MAELMPVFNLDMSGSGTANADKWIDLGVIPTGMVIQLGYASYMAIDKNMQFETRANLSGYSDGTAAHTELFDWTGAQSGSSVDRDFYQYGNLNITTAVGTGVEHFWLHITSQSSSAGGYAYIIRYTLQ